MVLLSDWTKENPWEVLRSLKRETDWYAIQRRSVQSYGKALATGNLGSLNLMSSNIRNQFNLSVENGWNRNMETEATYERYLYDYFRVFGGVNVENSRQRLPAPLTEPGATGRMVTTTTTTAVVGVRFLTPYLFSLDARIDNQLRPRLSLGRQIMVLPRLLVAGYYECQADFGWVNTLNNNRRFAKEVVWRTGAEYLLARNFSLMGSYENRFGGGGLNLRF